MTDISETIRQDRIDQLQARAEAAGQRMAQQGWAIRVTGQADLPSGDVAWSATLSHHGSVVGLVEQAGGGGAPLIRWGQGQARVHPAGPARPSEVWARDLAAASTDEETALSGLDRIDVVTAGSTAPAAAEPMTVPPGSEVTVALTFTVHDPGLLLDHARAAVAAHGAGHDLDRADLGDAIAEVLLHSNPDVPGYLDHGIELVAQRTSTNPGGWAKTVPSTLTLPAATPPDPSTAARAPGGTITGAAAAAAVSACSADSPVPDAALVIGIDRVARRTDGGIGESWNVAGRLELDGVVHDFTYRYEDLGHSGVDQTLTVALDGVDQGYEGWRWGDPPPPGATPIASRIDGEWLVDVIHEASIQQVFDGRYHGERAAIAALAGLAGSRTARQLHDPPPPDPLTSAAVPDDDPSVRHGAGR